MNSRSKVKSPARKRATTTKKHSFLIKNHERVVFWGDSITDNSYWCRTIENYVRCRHPSYHVDFINLGWGGDTTLSGKGRIKRDLANTNPTLVFIKLGMNDGGYQPFKQEACDTYLDGMKSLVDFIRNNTSAKIVFITTVPFERNVNPSDHGLRLDQWYAHTLRQFSDRLIAFARKIKCPVIDLNKLYQDEMARYKRTDPKVAFSEDGIHPDAGGNALMAALILQSLGADGTIMDLRVDLKKGAVVAATNQKISQVKRTENGLSFVRSPKALPFTFSGAELIRIDLAAWRDRLNKNLLRVTNVKSPYVLFCVNDRPLAAYTREQLRVGVNLSHLSLPEERAGAFVGRVVADKHAARYRRWRHVLLFGVANDRLSPFNKADLEAKYLKKLSDFQAKFLNDGSVVCDSYTVELRESDTDNLFAFAPFTVLPPFPDHDTEVQILFEIDTNPWKNIVSERTGKTLNFTPRLEVKGDFCGWELLPLFDNGERGDAKAGDGIYSLVYNVKRSNTPSGFSFDDDSLERGPLESEIMETIKLGLHEFTDSYAGNNFAFVPDTHKIVRITAEHFRKAVEAGKIKIAV